MSLHTCGGQSEIASGNIFIRKVRLTAVGQKVGGHTHNFDHTTIFLRGRVAVHTTTPSGEENDFIFQDGDHFLINKDVIHELTALDEYCEFWCVYSHRDEDGQITETYCDPRANV